MAIPGQLLEAATKLQQFKALAVGTFLQILSLSPGTFRELSGDGINSCTSSDYKGSKLQHIFKGKPCSRFNYGLGA